MSHEIFDIATGAALTTALLAAEHLALWELRDRLPLTARYTLGTLAIGAGLTVTLGRWSDWRGVAAFWACAVSGGALVAGAHLVRELLPQPADLLLEELRYGVRRTAP